jgi:RimJ/RimL family protein N-acetyltransferase
MRREAHFRRSVKIRDHWEDDVVYAILRDEWRSAVMQGKPRGG